jgi:CTP synthase (UTP-ammonia lyase)
MNRPLKVGIIGDFDPGRPSHMATSEAVSHAATALDVTVDCCWLPTQSLDEEASEASLKPFDALWCAPGSPYKSMDGALRVIRFSREQGWPFIGT